MTTLNTEKEYYDAAVKTLKEEFLVDPVSLGSFELGLGLHTAAPKIEAYYQFYNTSVIPSLEAFDKNCEDWVYFMGKQICTPEGLESSLSGINVSEER